MTLPGFQKAILKFTKSSIIRAKPERVFAFHESADALKLLIPPWEKARVIKAADISKIGTHAVVETRLFNLFNVRWVAEHTAYDPPNMFEDIQLHGPFRNWRHRHLVIPCPTGTILRDEIEYALPLGWLGNIVARMIVVRRLDRLFDYRHRITRRWCEEGSANQ